MRKRAVLLILLTLLLIAMPAAAVWAEPVDETESSAETLRDLFYSLHTG